MKEITLIQYRKETVDNLIAKRKRSMKTLRVLFIALMVVSIQCFLIGAYYLYDPIFKGIDFTIRKYVWFGFMVIGSIALFGMCIWLYKKNNPNKLVETYDERIFYDNERMLYTYIDKRDSRGQKIEVDIPWDKITEAKYNDSIMGFVINGDFIKRIGKDFKNIKSVTIYDYMWDLKIVMFKHGIITKGNIV